MEIMEWLNIWDKSGSGAMTCDLREANGYLAGGLSAACLRGRSIV